MKIRLICFSGPHMGDPGFIVNIYETVAQWNSTGKFDAATQNIMNEQLRHLESGRAAVIEIVKEVEK